MANILQITEPPTLLREQAFERLRDAIITGHFAPGDRLVERELCEAMGVSRTSIREVLRRLEAERLIEVEPRRGPTVARVSRKQAAEIYEIRAQLEAILVRRFTERASENDIAKLRLIFEEVAEAAKTRDVVALVALGARFHSHMVKVVDHELIGDILTQLTARISFLRVKSMSHPGRIQASVGEMSNMIEAIERRDAKAAARHAVTFVDNACAAALERLDAEQG
jgi:GntR family transcriptional regulator, trigonelline degradation regulator